MESPSAGSYHPTQSPTQHNTSNHQSVPAHTTQPSPAPSGGEEWAKLLVTHMEEQEYNNREIENGKTYLENIKVYEGTDKQKCLPWVNRLQQAAKIDQKSRQSEVMRNRRKNSSELIDTTVNEISDIDINYIASRQGDSRFNSTMKPGYQRERKDFSPRN